MSERERLEATDTYFPGDMTIFRCRYHSASLARIGG